MFFFDKFKKGLEKTKQTVSQSINNAFSIFKKIDDELYDELLEAMVLSDMSRESSEYIIETLKRRRRSPS